jgi:hypothetical protein
MRVTSRGDVSSPHVRSGDVWACMGARNADTGVECRRKRTNGVQLGHPEAGYEGERERGATPGTTNTFMQCSPSTCCWQISTEIKERWQLSGQTGRATIRRG